MKQFVIYTTMLVALLIALNLSAVNQMAQMTFMSGEFAGSEYGNAMASLDFNGDGYRDLVVVSTAWNTAHVYAGNQTFGKLYFYWGGPGFDNVPDFVIEGTYSGQLNSTCCFNAGDVNNDGIDDLVINDYSPEHNRQVVIFYGRTIPQATPDVVLSFPYPEVDWISIAPLGDINSDNHDDLSIVQYTSPLTKTYIWTDVTSQPWLFKQTPNIYCRTILSGVGDVNGDSISDCYNYTPLNATGYIHNKMTILYGSVTFPQTDSVLICNDTNAYTTERGCPVGDVNGDGIADFVAYDNHLWFGRQNLTAQWDVALSAEYSIFDYGFTENCTGFPFVHGDFNNDGYEDVAASNHEYGGNAGVFFIFLGRNHMNGIIDFRLHTPQEYPHHNFGWSKVTGDFNADGFCDIAVGAPWWYNNDHIETGRVYVYAGNADLEDTTVANDDNVVPVKDSDLWKVEVYPNPTSSKQKTVNVKFVGNGYKSTDQLTLTVYNVKGQKLQSETIQPSRLKGDSIELELPNSRTGLLIVKISEQGRLLTSTKVLIR